MCSSRASSPRVEGDVDDGFGAGSDEFFRSFTERREPGAAATAALFEWSLSNGVGLGDAIEEALGTLEASLG